MQCRREAPGRQRLAGVGQWVSVDSSIALAQRRLDGLAAARGVGLAPDKAILHHLQRTTAALVNARVPLALEQAQDLGLAEVQRNLDRERQHEPGIAVRLRARRELFGYLCGGVTPHGFAAAAAVERGGPREQQFEMIVELRHRADGRARGPYRIVLIDRDRGRNALDAIDGGLVHAV